MRFWTKFDHQFISYFFPSCWNFTWTRAADSVIKDIKAARYGWPYCRFHYFIGPVYSNDWFTAKTARFFMGPWSPSSFAGLEGLPSAALIRFIEAFWCGVAWILGCNQWLVSAFAGHWKSRTVWDCFGRGKSYIYIIFSIGELPQVEIPQPVFLVQGHQGICSALCLQS